MVVRFSRNYFDFEKKCYAIQTQTTERGQKSEIFETNIDDFVLEGYRYILDKTSAKKMISIQDLKVFSFGNLMIK